jgi:hypothetical protein
MAVVAATFVWSCSGGRIIEPEPVVEPAAESEIDPRLVSNDPFEKRLVQFEAAYAELVCCANMNYDAMASMGMVVEPWDQMQEYAKEKSTSLDPYLDILKRNGYADLAAFEAARVRIDGARRGWWGGLTGQLFDILEDCHKPAP